MPNDQHIIPPAVKFLARLPAREIDGADQVLEGALVEVASGNQCRLWPALTYDAGADQTRIAFFMEWRCAPTPNDMSEITAYTNSLMGKPPALVTETHEDPCTDRENVEWLRSGKPPACKRAN